MNQATFDIAKRALIELQDIVKNDEEVENTNKEYIYRMLSQAEWCIGMAKKKAKPKATPKK